MAKFSPQNSSYKIINALQRVCDFIFWAIFILSIASVVWPQLSESQIVKEALDLINIVTILSFFVLEVIIGHILFPIAEQKRREDFIDNSFGSKMSIVNSVEYYDNEEVKTGLYKAGVNLFQNVFVTYCMVKSLTWRKIIFPTVVLFSVCVIAYYGFRHVPFALTFLQVFFSARTLGELVKHLILLSHLDRIQNGLISLFKHEDLNSQLLNHQSEIFRWWISYETLISRINPTIPEGLFAKMNLALTSDWVELKKRFSIK